MRILTKDGTVILESDEIDLKITPDREVWVRRADNGKKKPYFESINRKVDYGLSVDEKQLFLMNVRYRFLEMQSQQKEDKPCSPSGN
jgi:ABC-type taurine transport system substrate-binding protein